LFNYIIKWVKNLKEVLEIFPEYKDALFDVYKLHQAGHMTFCGAGEMLNIFPNRKFEIAQKMLADWDCVTAHWWKLGWNKGVINNFPENKLVFNIIIDLRCAVDNKSARDVECVLNRIKTEVHGDDNFLLLSHTLSDCKAFNLLCSKCPQNEFTGKINELREYLKQQPLLTYKNKEDDDDDEQKAKLFLLGMFFDPGSNLNRDITQKMPIEYGKETATSIVRKI
jgi:hypothetical protein